MDLMSMIHSVFLYIAESGLPVLSHYFSSEEIELDSSLTSGFLEAMRNFIANLINVESEVETISMRDYQIIYQLREGLALVALVDEYTEEEIVRKGLENVLRQINEKFPEMGAEQTLGFVQSSEKEEKCRNEIKNILQDGHLGHISHVPQLVRKIPKSAISLGMISPTEFIIAELCDGKRTLEEIANLADKSETDVKIIIEKLIADRICQMVEVKK